MAVTPTQRYTACGKCGREITAEQRYKVINPNRAEHVDCTDPTKGVNYARRPQIAFALHPKG